MIDRAVNRANWNWRAFYYFFYDRDRRSKGCVVPEKRPAAVAIRNYDVSFYVHPIERCAEYLSAIPARDFAVHAYVLAYVLVGPELLIVDVSITRTVVYEVPYCKRRCRMPLNVVGTLIDSTPVFEARPVVGLCILAVACGGDSFVCSIGNRESASASSECLPSENICCWLRETRPAPL